MWLLYILPKRLLSRMIGFLAAVRLPQFLSQFIIRTYAAKYQINFDDILRPLDSFGSLAQFFVRELKPELRPLGMGLVSPVDGVLRSGGPVRNGVIEDVKGQSYSTQEFLGSSNYAGGFYLNFYLSPRDCHHVYAPCEIKIVSNHFFPGTLWPVNDWAFANIRKVLCKNERWVSFFESEFGKGALVMIGAFNVGGIELSAAVRGQGTLLKGEKFGTFHLGSSVVLVFEDGSRLAPQIAPQGRRVLYGESLSLLA